MFYLDRQASQQKVFANQPSENLDQPIIEVKIRIKDADRAQILGLTNLQVQTIITTPPL